MDRNNNWDMHEHIQSHAYPAELKDYILELKQGITLNSLQIIDQHSKAKQLIFNMVALFSNTPVTRMRVQETLRNAGVLTPELSKHANSLPPKSSREIVKRKQDKNLGQHDTDQIDHHISKKNQDAKENCYRNGF